MKAPAFWERPPGIWTALLAPASLLYGTVAARRLARTGKRAAIPVVCVGNVTVGGSGKTPTAIAVAQALRALGREPAFLTRGYGGSLAGPVFVDPERHAAAETGDEPLLLAAHAPTVVSRHRPAGAALAAAAGAAVVVMDDGLQNPGLVKDLALAVFDGATGIGNGHVLPAGPLRAPMRAQWPLIDALVVVGPGAPGDAIATEAARRGLPVLRAALRPRAEALDALRGRQLLAFAGIGRPEKLFAACREAGLDVAATRAFPDHHAYTQAELSDLLDQAEREALVPLTTEKDMVRLAPRVASEPRVALIRTLPVEMIFDEPGALTRLLRERLAGFPA